MLYKHVHVGRSVVIFGSIPKSNFLRLLGLRHFALYLCYFYRFLCNKVFNQHLFCVISMFVNGNMLI